MVRRGTARAKVKEMAGRNSKILLILSLFLLLSGCRKPSGDYLFVSAETAAAHGGSYDFMLNLDDSTHTWNAKLAARIVTSRIPDGAIAFDVRITSPVGESSIERLSLPLSEATGVRVSNNQGPVTDFEWPLHGGIRPDSRNTGTWKISISPTDATLGDALYGVGIAYGAE